MSRRTLLLAYMVLAGLADTSTGLLLVVVPRFTLRLMHIQTPPQPIEFAGYLGVFVLAVGLSYLWAASCWTLAEWRVQWWITALTRTLVAGFLLVEVAGGRMEPAWITVAAADGAMAALQWFGLARGWLAHA